MKTKCVIQNYQDEDRLAIDSVVLAAWQAPFMIFMHGSPISS